MADADYVHANDSLPPPRGLSLENGDVPCEEGIVLSFPLARRSSGRGRESAVLTPTERAVLRELLQGRKSCEIAAGRRVSNRTVANQISSIFRKLKVHSRLELALLLLPQGAVASDAE